MISIWLWHIGISRWLSAKESACQFRRHGFHPWVGKIPWRRKWQFISVFLPGKLHGQRGLVGTVHGVARNQTWLSDWAPPHVMHTGIIWVQLFITHLPDHIAKPLATSLFHLSHYCVRINPNFCNVIAIQFFHHSKEKSMDSAHCADLFLSS